MPLAHILSARRTGGNHGGSADHGGNRGFDAGQVDGQLQIAEVLSGGTIDELDDKAGGAVACDGYVVA